MILRGAPAVRLWCAKVGLHKKNCELSILGLIWNSRGVCLASPLAEMKEEVRHWCTAGAPNSEEDP